MIKRDTFELIQKLAGNIEPCAETNIDNDHLANLKEWCELHERIIDEIISCADDEDLREYYSAERIISYARSYLRDVQDKLDNYIPQWNEYETKDSDNNDFCF